MNLHSKTPRLTGSIVRNGGSVVSKGVAPSNYLTPSPSSTEIDTRSYAAAVVATRFRLRIETARLVCTLSGLGGAI